MNVRRIMNDTNGTETLSRWIHGSVTQWRNISISIMNQGFTNGANRVFRWDSGAVLWDNGSTVSGMSLNSGDISVAFDRARLVIAAYELGAANGITIDVASLSAVLRETSL